MMINWRNNPCMVVDYKFQKLGRLHSVFVSYFFHDCNEKSISLKQQLYNDDHWNPISYINIPRTSSLIFTRLKYVRRSSVLSKKPFLCLTCHVHHVWNRNKRHIFKDISMITFSCCNKRSRFTYPAIRHSLLRFQYVLLHP